jgi:hypothetical protein
VPAKDIEELAKILILYLGHLGTVSRWLYRTTGALPEPTRYPLGFLIGSPARDPGNGLHCQVEMLDVFALGHFPH